MQNDDVGGKLLKHKRLPDSWNLRGEKKKKGQELFQYQMKLYYTYASFWSSEITQT